MKVTHLACIAPPETGGIGQVAYDEVMGLRERGVDARLVSSGNGWTRGMDQVLAEKSDVVYRLPSIIRVGNAALIRGLGRVVQDADIIHLHYPWYGVAEFLLSARPKKPVVVTFHMDASASDLRGVAFAAHRYLLQSRLLRNASRILVSSRDYAEHSSLAPLLSELGDKIVQLPFALDTDFFSPSEQKAVSHDKGAHILFVGGLDKAHHFKGLPLLLRALTALPKSITLKIVGDGGERARFEKDVVALDLVSRVAFLGRVSREALRDTYRDADVLAFPSTSVAEAFGLVALEAQACGVPVVASGLPGVRTVVQDGETGILVSPGSAEALTKGIMELCTNQEKRQIYAKNARVHALQGFSQKTHIDKLLEVYQAL
ncbi:glycosyltransferase [Patescibacteria group bacterium]|nr:glycosyltransferase [Patescibacteria group bacterium]MBP9709736.1 glycosyltransferase [Patescibacteria group bacterium]